MLAQVESDVHDKDGDISEQGSAKKPRGLNHLPAAAAAGAGHTYLLQILQGQNFDAEQMRVPQPIRTGQQHVASPSAATVAHQKP